MKNIYRLACASLLLCGLAAAQSGVRAEAAAKLQKEKHEAMVEHAKALLVQKSSLEAQLAEVEKKLVDLDNGKDVPPTLNSITWSDGSCCVCPANGYITSGTLIGR